MTPSMDDGADLRALVIQLVRVETKLDNFAVGHHDHEQRLRRLERVVWIASGMAAAIGGVVGNVLGPILGGT